MQQYVDDAIAGISVDFSNSMLLDGTQAMTANMDLGGFQINDLATPTASGDATNKDYVDQAISGIDTSKWDTSGNELSGSEVLGSTNNQNVTLIRNGSTELELQDGQIEHSSSIVPISDNSLNLGASGFDYVKVYTKSVGNTDAGSFTISQNNVDAITIDDIEAQVDRHLVIQSKGSDNENKVFNVKNSVGVSVASIDEDGDMIVNDLTVNGVETVVGNIQAQSDLLLEGNLTVSGSVTLGNESTDAINFVGRSETDLNMNNNFITKA